MSAGINPRLTANAVLRKVSDDDANVQSCSTSGDDASAPTSFATPMRNAAEIAANHAAANVVGRRCESRLTKTTKPATSPTKTTALATFDQGSEVPKTPKLFDENNTRPSASGIGSQSRYTEERRTAKVMGITKYTSPQLKYAVTRRMACSGSILRAQA